ncbi:hypothetical protein ACSVCE_05930 [Chromobacterium haemolyticum]|uniref:hypothetical protein n=1 Tax=Chromobacterium haemolyticum TaxID=394935 RepID=UPI0040556EEE
MHGTQCAATFVSQDAAGLTPSRSSTPSSACDEALVTTMPKADFPPGVKVGGQIQRIGPDGEPRY